MKYYTWLLLVALCIFFGCSVSNKVTNHALAKTGHLRQGIVYYFNGIKFYPSSKEGMSIDSPCENIKRVFNLDGLRLNEVNFKKLNLTRKDIHEEKAVFYSHATKGCIDTINFFLELKIPYRLNGYFLDKKKQKQILTNLTPEAIQVICKKNKLLTSFININTNTSY